VYPGSPTSLVRGPGEQEMRGVTVEVGRAMADRLQLRADIVVFERVAEVIDALKQGRVDMTITNATPARATEVDFTPALIGLELGLLVPAGSTLSTVEAMDQTGLRIGVSQGSSSQAALGARLKAAHLVPAPSLNAAANLLRTGQIDAFATNKGILFELADQVPGSRVLSGRWGLESLALAIPKGRTQAREWVQNFAREAAASGLVSRAAERAGLRGTVSP